MPFFLVLSAKSLVTAAAIIGGTAAIVANREKIFEAAERLFLNGAILCHQELDKHRGKTSHFEDDACYKESEFIDEIIDWNSEPSTPSTSEYGSAEESEEEGESASRRYVTYGRQLSVDAASLD